MNNLHPTQPELRLFAPVKRTAKSCIREVLEAATGPLAVHEFNIFGYSENNLATRLSEMARSGEIVGRTRFGAKYREWALPGRFW